jgi:hypothetical protein
MSRVKTDAKLGKPLAVNTSELRYSLLTKKTVFRIVGSFDDLSIVGERVKDSNGSEDLIGVDFGVVCYIGENGRIDKISFLLLG